MTVAVLDARGCVVALKMEDGSSLLRPDIASGKAWSALAMGFGTRNLKARAKSLPSFFAALAALADPALIEVLWQACPRRSAERPQERGPAVIPNPDGQGEGTAAVRNDADGPRNEGPIARHRPRRLQ